MKQAVVDALEDIKGYDITVMDVRKLTSMASLSPALAPMSFSGNPGRKEPGTRWTQNAFFSVNPLAAGAVAVMGWPSQVPV